jgi:hypothetical protein
MTVDIALRMETRRGSVPGAWNPKAATACLTRSSRASALRRGELRLSTEPVQVIERNSCQRISAISAPLLASVELSADVAVGIERHRRRVAELRGDFYDRAPLRDQERRERVTELREFFHLYDTRAPVFRGLSSRRRCEKGGGEMAVARPWF